MRLAAASMVTAFQLETRDIRELDRWVDRHTDAGGDTPIASGDPFETTLIMGMISAAFVRAAYPTQIDSDALTLRLQSLIDQPSAWLSDDQRVQAARLLVENGRIFAKLAQAASAITATRSLIDNSVGGALHRGRWLIISAHNCFVTGDPDGASRYLSEARSLAEQSGSSRLSFELGLAFAEHWMKLHDLERATSELASLGSVGGKRARGAARAVRQDDGATVSTARAPCRRLALGARRRCASRSLRALPARTCAHTR